jgi:hypothetical protein
LSDDDGYDGDDGGDEYKDNTMLSYVSAVHRFLHAFASLRDQRYKDAREANQLLSDARNRLSSIIAAGSHLSSLSDGASMPPILSSSGASSAGDYDHAIDSEAKIGAEADIKTCETALSAANTQCRPSFGRGLHLVLIPIGLQQGITTVVEVLLRVSTVSDHII